MPHKLMKPRCISNSKLCKCTKCSKDVNDTLPNPKETGKEYHKTATVFAVQMDKPFKVDTLEGVMQGNAGDYLCQGVENEMWPVKKRIFESTYEVIPGKK